MPIAFQTTKGTDGFDPGGPPHNLPSFDARGLSSLRRLRLEAAQGNDPARVPKGGERSGSRSLALALSLHRAPSPKRIEEAQAQPSVREAPRKNRQLPLRRDEAFPVRQAPSVHHPGEQKSRPFRREPTLRAASHSVDFRSVFAVRLRYNAKARRCV